MSRISFNPFPLASLSGSGYQLPGAKKKRKRKDTSAWLDKGPYAAGRVAPTPEDPILIPPPRGSEAWKRERAQHQASMARIAAIDAKTDKRLEGERAAFDDKIAGINADTAAMEKRIRAALPPHMRHATWAEIAEHNKKADRILGLDDMTSEELQSALNDPVTGADFRDTVRGLLPKEERRKYLDAKLDRMIAEKQYRLRPRIPWWKRPHVGRGEPQTPEEEKRLAEWQGDFEEERAMQGLTLSRLDFDGYRQWRNTGRSHAEWFRERMKRKHAEGIENARVAVLEQAKTQIAAGEKVDPAVLKLILTGQYGGGGGTFGGKGGKMFAADSDQNVYKGDTLVQRGVPKPERRAWQEMDTKRDIQHDVETGSWRVGDETVYGSVPVDAHIPGRYYEKGGKIWESVNWDWDVPLGRLATQEEKDTEYQKRVQMFSGSTQGSGGAGLAIPSAQSGAVGGTQGSAEAIARYMKLVKQMQDLARSNGEGSAEARKALKANGLSW